MTLPTRKLPDTTPPEIVRDPGILGSYLEDASGAPAGRTPGLARPGDEAEAAALLRATLDEGLPVLCQAARTSLTGGAVPQGELVVSVEALSAIGPVEAGAGGAVVRVQPGVRLDALRHTLAARGWYYPPVPTYEQAMIGGTVATNAGGAATFKYGVTRQWVRGLRVLLFNGDLLELERGQAVQPRGGSFSIELTSGDLLRIPVPGHSLPPLKKISAGYHASDPFDLLDLFVGSEGTLGLITSVTLDLVPLPPSVVTGLIFTESFDRALALASDLRVAALEAREGRGVGGPDVRAIESIDGDGLDLLRGTEVPRRLRIRIPEQARAALLFEMELTSAMTNDEAQRVAEQVLEGRGDQSPTPLASLFRVLLRHESLDRLELAFPEDDDRRRALKELREAVPHRVNELLAERRRRHRGIRKVAGDLIVPFSRIGEMVRYCDRRFADHGLQCAVWGHLSDGNLHPNALPRTAEEVDRGFEAIHRILDEAVRLGGCPLSEHGVGRDPFKRGILERFVGRPALEGMRRIKRAVDPPWRFAPGVLFPPPGRG